MLLSGFCILSTESDLVNRKMVKHLFQKEWTMLVLHEDDKLMHVVKQDQLFEGHVLKLNQLFKIPLLPWSPAPNSSGTVVFL